jgi:glycosyltransferase involved in cell wall biosynthesis
MKILHIAATLGRGGIATSIWHLLPALKKLPDCEVDGAVFYEKGWFGELLEEEGIWLNHLKLGHKYDPRAVFKLVRLQREYDIVHAHGWPIILFVALASFISNKPTYILSEHSVTNRRRRPFLKWVDRFIYARFDYVVAVSEAVAVSLREWLPQVGNKIAVIHNGIQSANLQTAESKNDIRQRLDLDPQTPVIFASGNFRLAKGFDLLLQSFVILNETYFRDNKDQDQLPVLVITGEGGLQSSMQELSRQLGIEEQVRFLGFRTDMPVILKAADLFVLSSRWEGCPMVILESMTLGVPVLATNVGGVPELIVEDQTGKLVPPGSPEKLAEGIYEMLTDKERAACFAEQGQTRLSQFFAIDRNAQIMNSLYQQAAGFVN